MDLVIDLLNVTCDLLMASTFGIIFWQLRTARSAAKVSLLTLASLATTRLLHLSLHFRGRHHQTRVLPSSASWCCDMMGAIGGVACLYLFLMRYYRTYEKEEDDFGAQLLDRCSIQLPQKGPLKHRNVAALVLLYTVIAVFAVAWFIAVGGQITGQRGPGYLECFGDCLGAVALIPQLWMFHKTRRAPRLLSLVVVSVALARCCMVSTFLLARRKHLLNAVGSEMTYLLIVADFVYYWARSTIKGQKEVILPC
eukprot:gb/GFBE01083468.1/.p1 GENE.gb/GFBE01083468.1/~~gb/GFBE01083468.1/.p1  ORF type:complete len:253 (+),score=50.85 gb/GFBE01083468.1/:1-759(+)